MSYATVRAAVRDYFANAAIVGMQTVYLDMPWFIDAAQWPIEVPAEEYDPDVEGATVPRTWAAVAFVHIDTSAESRITVGAPQPLIPDTVVGYKEVQYVVSLGMSYQYLVPVNLSGEPQHGDEWVLGLDTIIDAVKDLIRADPELGASGNVIFQAGQDDNDIRVESDFPVADQGGVRVYSYHRVSFNVTEIINA